MASNILFKSRLNLFRFIGPGFFVLLIIPSAIYVFKVYFTGHLNTLTRDDRGPAYVLPLLGLAAGIYALYLATRHRQSLLADNHSISIGKQVISYSDIEKIDAVAHEDSTGPFSYNSYDELVVITLKQGGELTVYTDNYSNGVQFRAICQQINGHITSLNYNIDSFTLPPKVDIYAIQFNTLASENFTTFKSRPFRFIGLLYPPFFWVLAFVSFGAFLTIKNAGAFVLLMVGLMLASAGFYLLWVIVSQQNRFLLSENYLVIKSNVFLRSPVIPLHEIKEISPQYFDSWQGMPRGDYLHIITSDCRVHIFGMPASYKHLQGMIDEINAKIKQN